MIGYDEIAATCSRLDDLGERGIDLPTICAERGIAVDELLRAAEQRALRIGAMMAGQDPRLFSRTERTPVDLDPELRDTLRWLLIAFIDGFMAGREVSNPADRIQRFPERRDP